MKRLALLSLLVLPIAANASIEELLAKITIKDEIVGDDYDRESHFGDWTDDDNDGLSTRQEVLEQESLIPVTYDGDKVVSGFWYDPFTGKNFTYPNRPGSKYAVLQIDHIVPLKEAWQSGAKDWTKEQRVKFANDMTNYGHLIAVRGGTNASKGYKDPAEWMPPNEQFHCAYVITWTGIKAEWGLSMDKKEHDFILDTLSNCAFEK